MGMDRSLPSWLQLLQTANAVSDAYARDGKADGPVMYGAILKRLSREGQ
jgi:hypothetical protein